MTDIKDRSITYYSNAAGDLFHANGTPLKSFIDLPIQLQEAYQRYWREGGSWMLNYLVRSNDDYGLALVSEWVLNIEPGESAEEWRARMDKYFDEEIVPHAERLESLIHKITGKAEVSIGRMTGDDGCHEIMVFIPTWGENRPRHSEICRVLFAIDKFHVDLDEQEILSMTGLREYLASKEISEYSLEWPLNLKDEEKAVLRKHLLRFRNIRRNELICVGVYTEMPQEETVRRIESTIREMQKKLREADGGNARKVQDANSMFAYLYTSALNALFPGHWEKFISNRLPTVGIDTAFSA